ncbi:MAG: GNAT family N-acetyltransferase [Vicinamibacterales bacterium]
MVGAVEIRPFREGDAPALWRVFYSAIRQTAAKDYTPEQIVAWAPTEFDAAKWAERMRGIQPFVAEQDGAIVGYADVQANGYIDHFFVSPTVVRQGVGSRLMQSIHDRAAVQGFERLFSDVSLTARPFYERWGFSVEEARTLTVAGVMLDNFRMSKALPLRA